MKTVTVVTHAGKFHADDIFAVATMSLLFEKKKWKMKLIRTLDPVWIKKADFVLDIGRVYNAKKNRFDHHQAETAGKRKNGILYASFGLAWKHFGDEVSGDKKVAAIVDQNLVTPIDAYDVGISTYTNVFKGIKPVTIDTYFNVETNNILDLYDEDKAEKNKMLDLKFKHLVDVAKEIIQAHIISAELFLKNEKLARRVYQEAKDKKLLILDRHIKFDFSEFQEPLMIVYPHNRRGWAVQNVKVPNSNFKGRIFLPKKWRGKVDEDLAKASGVKDAFFAHNSGFLAAAESKEGAIQLAKKAIKAAEKS